VGHNSTDVDNYIDTLMAAGLWANSRDAGSYMYGHRFRQIKAAIRKGAIKNTRQADNSRGPNVHTQIPLAELRAYFARTGVIE
jgi:hypothetical protein